MLPRLSYMIVLGIVLSEQVHRSFLSALVLFAFLNASSPVLSPWLTLQTSNELSSMKLIISVFSELIFHRCSFDFFV